MNHENKKKTDECTNIFSLMYMVLVFGLLFYVKNDWCDLLFKNFTVGAILPFVITILRRQLHRTGQQNPLLKL